MMMSPLASRPPSVSTVSSVIFPAGSMTHTTRGFSASALATASKEGDAVAPSFASSSRDLAFTSKTTQPCPACISRRHMLPPMRPKPMTPICMSFTPNKNQLTNRPFNSLRQLRQSGVDILEMNAQGAAAALDQNIKITARLRRLHHAEAISVAGHIEIGRVIARDLQEDPGVGPAFVCLAGRMQETRAEAKTSAGACAVPQARASGSQLFRMCLVALDVGQQGDVIA